MVGGCADPGHGVTSVVMRTPVLVAAMAFIALSSCCNRDHIKTLQEPIDSAEPAPAAVPARCTMIGKETVVGDKPANPTSEDELLPFASEVGQGVAFDGGFALGVLHPAGGGTRNAVVTVSNDGSSSRVVELGDSHGDAEPPHVFAKGAVLGAAVLDPTGASRTLRLARIDGDTVHWASEIRQGVDESDAFDVVLGKERGLVVWDDVPKDRDVSGVYVSSFKVDTFESPTPARVVTLPGVDADSPRLVVRPGGFWLFWLVRRAQETDYDARYRAEDIAYRWLEVVPLDDAGLMAGAPRRIGSDTGHVLAYDVAASGDGGALVAWRDDDTPSGSMGGQLLVAMVRQGGIDGPDSVDDAHTGVGAPTLMNGWLAIADATGPTRIAPMSADGKLLDALRSEALLGMGEPLADRGDTMLIARPTGLAVRLFLAKCTREKLDAGDDDAQDTAD